MDFDNGPSAQDQQPQSEVQPSGVESRINELVAKFHESERERTKLMGTIAEQQSTLAAIQARNAQPVEREDVVPQDFDVTNPAHLHAIINRATAAATKPLQDRVNQLTNQFSSNQISSQMAELGTKLQKLNNPEVANRVDSLVAAWRKSGHLDSGVATPKDAYLIAMGEWADGQLGGAFQNRDERGRFNAAGGVVGVQNGGGGRPATRGGAQIEEAFNDLDLNTLSSSDLNKLIDELDRRNPDGVPLKK